MIPVYKSSSNYILCYFVEWDYIELWLKVITYFFLSKGFQ